MQFQSLLLTVCLGHCFFEMLIFSWFLYCIHVKDSESVVLKFNRKMGGSQRLDDILLNPPQITNRCFSRDDVQIHVSKK